MGWGQRVSVKWGRVVESLPSHFIEDSFSCAFVTFSRASFFDAQVPTKFCSSSSWSNKAVFAVHLDPKNAFTGFITARTVFARMDSCSRRSHLKLRTLWPFHAGDFPAVPMCPVHRSASAPGSDVQVSQFHLRVLSTMYTSLILQ